MSNLRIYTDINHITARLLNENNLAMIFVKNPKELTTRFYRERYVIYAKIPG